MWILLCRIRLAWLRQTAPSSPTEMADGKQLVDLISEYFSWYLQDAPEFATMSCCSEHNDRLESMTLSAAIRRNKQCIRFLKCLEKLSLEGLHHMDQTNAELLKEDLTSIAHGYKWICYSVCNPVNYFETIPNKFSTLGTYVRPGNLTDLQDYMARLKGIPVNIDEQIEVLNEAMKLGTTLHERSIQLAIQKMQPHITSQPKKSVFYAPFLEAFKSISGIKVILNN